MAIGPGYSHCAAKLPIKSKRKRRHRDQPKQGTVQQSAYVECDFSAGRWRMRSHEYERHAQ